MSSLASKAKVIAYHFGAHALLKTTDWRNRSLTRFLLQ